MSLICHKGTHLAVCLDLSLLLNILDEDSLVELDSTALAVLEHANELIDMLVNVGGIRYVRYITFRFCLGGFTDTIVNIVPALRYVPVAVHGGVMYIYFDQDIVSPIPLANLLLFPVIEHVLASLPDHERHSLRQLLEKTVKKYPQLGNPDTVLANLLFPCSLVSAMCKTVAHEFKIEINVDSVVLHIVEALDRMVEESGYYRQILVKYLDKLLEFRKRIYIPPPEVD